MCARAAECGHHVRSGGRVAKPVYRYALKHGRREGKTRSMLKNRILRGYLKYFGLEKTGFLSCVSVPISGRVRRRMPKPSIMGRTPPTGVRAFLRQLTTCYQTAESPTGVKSYIAWKRRLVNPFFIRGRILFSCQFFCTS